MHRFGLIFLINWLHSGARVKNRNNQLNMIYNCHTHVFTVKCAPDRFIGVPIAKLLSNRLFSFWLTKTLRIIIPGKKDFLDKYANFVAIGREKSQEQVFEDLQKFYPSDTHFVVLTMDMDFMKAGEAILNYPSQLSQIIEIKKKYPDRFIPFVSIDPRRGDTASLLAFLRLHIEKLGFGGIKLYPSLGFFPFDSRLSEVYQYAEKNQIPIIVHCTNGGIFYRGKNYTQEQLIPDNLNKNSQKKFDFSEFKHLKNHEFKNFFLDPDNYLEILQVYPKLKLCFAHYGGNDQIIASKKGVKNTWYEKIKKLLNHPDYPNVYTDISYTLSDSKVFNYLVEDIRNPDINHKILFGTDFFMTTREKREDRLFSDFRKVLNASEFELIANENPSLFLKINL